MTIPAVLARTVSEHGSRTAIVDGGRSLTWHELAGAAGEVAAALVASGLQPGDAVSLWAPNSVRWVTAFLGLELAGCVLVPVNTRFRGIEAADVLARGHVRALLTVTDFLDQSHLELLHGHDLPALDLLVVLSGDVPDGALSWEALLARATPSARAAARARAAAVGPDDRCDILFTSGTTGRPKGVVQTHARTLQVASDWVAMTGLACDDSYLMVNPYFHMFGLKAGILACLCAGATMLPEPVFDVARVLARVEAQRVTVLPGAPTVYQALLDHPGRKEHDLSSLRIAVTGAADIPVELIRRVVDELPFTTVISGYGLTEGGTAASTDERDDVTAVATTVGRPRPGFQVRLLGADGAEVADGQPGQIVLRGASIMSHYLDDPAATAEVLSADGWLQTGDLGVRDAEGRLRIVGRSKDMFIVGGFNAYPAEIEDLLRRHPDVAQVAVIGVPDDRLGEVGMAFVVPRPGAAPTAAEVIAWSRQTMANYKVPRRVELIDALPLTATGKVVKDELRARAALAR